MSSDDYVIIFYSQKVNTISFDVHKELLSSTAKIEYKFVDVGGQNALDFQLSSYLGYLINKIESAECKICIVSKDKGFAFVTAFWKKEKNIDIQVLKNLTGKDENPIQELQKQNDDIESALAKSNISLTTNEIREIIAMVKEYKTTQTINSNLNKSLKDSTKSGAILKIVKPFIKK